MPLATLAALIAAFALSACGGDADDGGADSDATSAPGTAAATLAATEPSSDATVAPELTIDACALVPKERIEAAIGVPVLEGDAEAAANLFTCSYNDPEFTNISTSVVSLFVADDEADAREVFDTAKSNAAEVQAVSGLGEEAFWDATLNGMQVLSGRFLFGVDVASEEGRDQVAAASAIATEALAALP